MPRLTPARRGAPPAPAALDYEADVLEGLEPFARAELAALGRRQLVLAPPAVPGVLRFSHAGPPTDLLALRSVVAVYLSQTFAVPRPKALLGHQHFEALLRQIALVRALWPDRAFATLRLSAAGEDTSVLTRLKESLAERTGLAVAPDEGDLLLRLRRAGAGWELLLRISPRPLATRAWRVCNRPGALNATVAHALLRMTEPQPADCVLNLACGSGTLLVERLALGPARRLIGCDTDPLALECARANLAAAGVAPAVELEPWDAGRLPLADASVDVLCADLPFGQLVGSHQDNQLLYPRIFAEATRVARPGARMALFTHELRLLERVAADYAADWQISQAPQVRVGGMAPRMYLLLRT